MLEVMPPLLAVILVVPTMDSAVAKPLTSIVATAGVPDVHVSVPKLADVPSVMVPVAPNWHVPKPEGHVVAPVVKLMLAEDGEMVILANTGGPTVKAATFEVIPFNEAVMLVVPC